MRKAISLFFGARSLHVLLILDRVRLIRNQQKAYAKHLASLRQEHGQESGQRADELAERARQVKELRQRITEMDEIWSDTVEEKWDVEKTISRRATWLKVKRLFGNQELDALENHKAELEDELASLERRLSDVRATLQQIGEEHAEIAAPIESLTYGIARIRRQMEESEGCLHNLDNALDDHIVAVVAQLPLDLLSRRLEALSSNGTVQLQLDDLLKLREQLRQRSGLARFPSARSMGLTEADGNQEQRVHAGYEQLENRGQGTVTVRGTGHKRVTRYRTVTDSNGHRRTESYRTRVKIDFRGVVKADYHIQYRCWRANSFARGLARNGRAELGQGRNRLPPVEDLLPASLGLLRQALGCGSRCARG